MEPAPGYEDPAPVLDLQAGIASFVLWKGWRGQDCALLVLLGNCPRLNVLSLRWRGVLFTPQPTTGISSQERKLAARASNGKQPLLSGNKVVG